MTHPHSLSLTATDAAIVLAVRLQPLTTLELDDSMLLSLDWGSDRILATGSSNGTQAS